MKSTTQRRATPPPGNPLSSAGRHGRRSASRPELYLAGVARAAGVCDSYVSMILNGTRTPSLRVAARLAKVLGLSLEEFYLQVRKAQEHKQEDRDNSRGKVNRKIA